MIQLVDTCKSYANGHQALSDINFHITPGEMVFLTGHSGAGKTTVLKLITRIEPVTSGQVIINKRNLAKLSAAEIPVLRQRMGMIFQNPLLLNQRNVFDNVAMPLIIAGFKRAEIIRRVHAALDKVGLLRKERLFPMDLSAGEQQRVGIARAVVNRPPVLLADEPTGNLDPELSFEIMRLFEAFNAVGVTVLVATHDLSLIASLHHRIITLKAGRIIGDQPDE